MEYKLNLSCGPLDKWGTHRLDWKSYGDKDITVFDLNSGKRLPYPSDMFSEVRLHNAIECLLYTQEVLEECNRVLRHGGTLDISFPDCEWAYYFFFPIRDNKVRFGKARADNGRTYGIWNSKMMSNRLEAAGFRVQSITKTHVGLMYTQRLVNIIARKGEGKGRRTSRK